jgi:hypothetical protein
MILWSLPKARDLSMIALINLTATWPPQDLLIRKRSKKKIKGSLKKRKCKLILARKLKFPQIILRKVNTWNFRPQMMCLALSH